MACNSIAAFVGRRSTSATEGRRLAQLARKRAFYHEMRLRTELKSLKINILIKDIQRNPHEGLGKPEPLKFDLAGLWSRRIDLDHRLVYRIEEGDLLIYACKYHYDKK